MTNRAKAAKPNDARRRLLWRLFWAAMLALHAPAAASIFSTIRQGASDEAAWSAFMLLGASYAYFFLELIFVSSMRLLSSRRSLLVFLLVIAILHVGAVQPAASSSPAADEQPWLFLATIGLLGWPLLRRLFASCRQASASETVEGFRQLSRLAYATLVEPLSTLCAPDCGWRASPLRAPPVRI